jgi:mRNA deadenylase 3'-5' endonuclease subunit Ccr4
MREVEQFVLSRGECGLIICGDLNSEPHSAVYELLLEGAVSRDHPDVDSSYHTGTWILPDVNTINHSLELSSAMCSALGNEPAFTNFTANFRGTLDYIIYTPARLKIMAASSIPEAHDLEAEVGVGLPSPSHASDHIMLCCDVSFVSSGSGSITRQQQPKHISSISPHHSMGISSAPSSTKSNRRK